MTPRVDNDFSDELVGLKQSQHTQYDLRSQAKLFEFPHPLILKAQISQKDNPQQEYALQHSFSDWNLFCFSGISELDGGNSLIRPHPHLIAQIIKNRPNEVVLNFDDLGCVMLTRNKRLLETTNGIHQMVLPLILNYVFSEDLWGPQGKWIRFHERLNGVFEKYKLLSGDTSPGFYSLNKKASVLKNWGFVGDESTENYSLTLPWTFSLTGLENLEKTVMQEF